MNNFQPSQFQFQDLIVECDKVREKISHNQVDILCLKVLRLGPKISMFQEKDEEFFKDLKRGIIQIARKIPDLNNTNIGKLLQED